jgi:hypothetical protein
MLGSVRLRPPAAVVMAVALYIVRFVLAPVTVDLWLVLDRWMRTGSIRWNVRWLVLDVIVTGLFLAVGYGLWRGRNGARVLTSVIVAAALVSGISQVWQVPAVWLFWPVGQMTLAAVTAVLLFVPTARGWFVRSEPSPSIVDET